MLRALDPADARLWWQKWRWYERSSLPWTRARIHYEFARRRAFCRWPVHGNVLEMLREGRLELGEHVLLEPNVWLTAQAPARIRIGGGSFLNLCVQVAAVELVEIGEHCMLANGCFVTDGNHRFDDPEKPVPWQGFTSKGPTRLGDNVWLGVNVVVTSGVTIGDRSVVGANSVVTTDLPPYSIAAGAPARVIKQVEYPPANRRGSPPGRTPASEPGPLGRRSPEYPQVNPALWAGVHLVLRQHDLHAEDDGGGECREREHCQPGVGDCRRSAAGTSRLGGTRHAEHDE